MFLLEVCETGLGPHSDFPGLYYLQVLCAKLLILLFIEEYAEKIMITISLISSALYML